MTFAYELVGKRVLTPDLKDIPKGGFAVRPTWSRDWLVLRLTGKPKGDADRGHEFIDIGARRWCIGCDLFQRRPWIGSPYPEPRRECPKSTPYAAAKDKQQRQPLRERA